MKPQLVLVLCLLAVCSATPTSNSEELEKTKTGEHFEYEKYLLWGHALGQNKHNLVLGHQGRRDLLLDQKVVTLSRSWIPFWRDTTKYTYSVPSPGYLTCVRVLDQSNNGKGGYATLISGGPGYRNVTLNFESQRNEPINFQVSIYGKSA